MKFLYIDKTGRGDVYGLDELPTDDDYGDLGDHVDIEEWGPEVGDELELRTFKLIRVQ